MPTHTDSSTSDKVGIAIGNIVCYKEGHYRVSYVLRSRGVGIAVNLKGVFTDHIHFKGVPIADVYEDEEAWYKLWQESETYKCM